MAYPFPPSPALPSSRLDWQPSIAAVYLLLFGAMVLGGVACYYVGLRLAPPDSNLVAAYGSGITFMLIGVLGTLLQFARRSVPARILAVLLLVLFHALIAAVLLAAAQLNADNPQADQTMRFILWGGIGVALLNVLCFTSPVRTWCAQRIPVDPEDFTHAYVLAICVAATGWALLSVLPFQQPLLYGMVGDDLSAPDALDTSPAATKTSLLSIAVWSVPAAALAVGFGVTRNLGQTLSRLGLQRTSLALVGAGVASAVLLVGAGLILNPLIQWLWTYLGWPTTDLQAFAELSNLPVDPLGVVILGVSAGVSEELLVRGILQPRLGIVAANVLFALGHAFQYAADGLLVVLALGLVFGIMRQRWGLVPAIIGHALYDIILLGLAVLYPDLMG